MLKKRIIGAILVKNGVAVQSIGFKCHLPVGDPQIVAKAFSDWGADEILLLDISATRNKVSINENMIMAVAKASAVPLTVGGGISSISQIRSLLKAGADKVSVNNVLTTDLSLLTEGRKTFGRQCMVASFDTKFVGNRSTLYDYIERAPTSQDVEKAIEMAIEAGAGEILVNSVDRDGSYLGFDLSTLKSISEKSPVPVIACGGAGKPDHFISLFQETEVSAGAAANVFNHTEHSIALYKSKINSLVQLRPAEHLDYSNTLFDGRGRPLRLSDRQLNDLLYEKLEIEIV